MAREDFESLVEAVKHVESRGQRYAANARQLLTSHKGAEGEMQVLPKTQKSPGYGIEPAKAGDPEDIARVGREYLRAMLDKYGNREHALAAYNWGPGNVDKWLAKGADPSKLPKETQNYLAKVNKRLGTQTADVSRETSPPAPTEAEKVVEPALRSGMSAQAPASPPVQAPEQLAAMGPSYQAALALAVLSDVDEEERKDRDIDDDREPSISQKWLMEQGSRPTALASLSDISIKSPFPEQAPVRMADGGDVSRPATFNPMIRRQGEAARRLAALRDVNTLPDPKTYAAVSSFLGTPPDELGFSVLHPKYQEIQRVAEPAFIAGTALGLAPAAKPVVQAGKAVAKAAAPKVGQAMEDYMFRQGMALPAVKPRGGNWLQDIDYATGEQVDPIANYLRNQISPTNDAPLDQWINKKLGNYMRREMGTENDPFVKAAMEGKRVHFLKNDPGSVSFRPADTALREVRRTEGFSPEGVATTPYSRAVERLTDESVWPITLETAQDVAPNLIPTALQKSVAASPSERLYELNPNVDVKLQISGLQDAMKQLRSMDDISFYQQPPVKIPERYRFSDQTLEGLTPVQASERVAQFDNWRQETKQRMASQALLKDRSLERATLDDNHTVVQLPDLEMNPKMRELAQDVGCDGDWCTRMERYALDYGSGNNRLSIILDNKARPKAQLTVSTMEPRVGDFWNSLEAETKNALARRHPSLFQNFGVDLELMRSLPEYQQWLKMNPPGKSISEIKGVNNTTDLLNQPFLPAVQKYVKDLDSNYNLRGVDNLEGIGLSDIRGMIREHASLRDNYTPEQVKAIEKEAILMNGGSKYTEKSWLRVGDMFEEAADAVMGR